MANILNVGRLLCFLMLFFWLSMGQAKAIEIDAKSAILIDQKTKQVLYEKNSTAQLPIASTTKIMTAILAIELADLSEEIYVSEHAAHIGEASIDLIVGEKINLHNLLLGTLIKSGNDAAVAVAELVAGNEEEFIMMMNKKAKLLGASSSSFKNPNGLPADSHFSTAFDLAVIACYAMENPIFREMVQIKKATIPYHNFSWQRELKNTNKLLWQYSRATGIKTGTTDAAGKCLVASADQGDTSLIAVLLNSPDRYTESEKLLQWGLENYWTETKYLKNQPLAIKHIPSGQPEYFSVSLTDNVVYTRSEESLLMEEIVWYELGLPLEEGDIIGKLVLTDSNQNTWSIDIKADKSVRTKTIMERIGLTIN